MRSAHVVYCPQARCHDSNPLQIARPGPGKSREVQPPQLEDFPRAGNDMDEQNAFLAGFQVRRENGSGSKGISPPSTLLDAGDLSGTRSLWFSSLRLSAMRHHPRLEDD
jgi:hypothetical protein